MFRFHLKKAKKRGKEEAHEKKSCSLTLPSDAIEITDETQQYLEEEILKYDKFKDTKREKENTDKTYIPIISSSFRCGGHGRTIENLAGCMGPLAFLTECFSDTINPVVPTSNKALCSEGRIESKKLSTHFAHPKLEQKADSYASTNGDQASAELDVALGQAGESSCLVDTIKNGDRFMSTKIKPLPSTPKGPRSRFGGILSTLDDTPRSPDSTAIAYESFGPNGEKDTVEGKQQVSAYASFVENALKLERRGDTGTSYACCHPDLVALNQDRSAVDDLTEMEEDSLLDDGSLNTDEDSFFARRSTVDRMKMLRDDAEKPLYLYQCESDISSMGAEGHDAIFDASEAVQESFGYLTNIGNASQILRRTFSKASLGTK